MRNRGRPEPADRIHTRSSALRGRSDLGERSGVLRTGEVAGVFSQRRCADRPAQDLRRPRLGQLRNTTHQRRREGLAELAGHHFAQLVGDVLVLGAVAGCPAVGGLGRDSGRRPPPTNDYFWPNLLKDGPKCNTVKSEPSLGERSRVDDRSSSRRQHRLAGPLTDVTSKPATRPRRTQRTADPVPLNCQDEHQTGPMWTRCRSAGKTTTCHATSRKVPCHGFLRVH